MQNEKMNLRIGNREYFFTHIEPEKILELSTIYATELLKIAGQLQSAMRIDFKNFDIKNIDLKDSDFSKINIDPKEILRLIRLGIDVMFVELRYSENGEFKRFSSINEDFRGEKLEDLYDVFWQNLRLDVIPFLLVKFRKSKDRNQKITDTQNS